MSWFLKCLTQKYATFSGRATRTEYWMFQLFSFICAFVLLFLMLIFSNGGQDTAMSMIFFMLFVIFGFGLIVPSLAVAVRRLHDSDKSGWFFFVCLIPFVGGIVFLILMCLSSTPTENRFGYPETNRV